MTSTLDTTGIHDQARDTYRDRLAAGQTITGKTLGGMYGKNEQWGRDRIGEVRAMDGPAELRVAAILPDAERQPDAADAAESAVDTADAAVPTMSSQSPGVSPIVQWTTRIAVAIVAAVAAAVSYAHMYQLAVHAGEGWRSWLLPLSVDGLIVAASMTLLVRKRAGLRGGILAWSAMWLGVLVSLVANVAAAMPTIEGRLVAAWPPLALLIGYELLMKHVEASTAGKVS